MDSIAVEVDEGLTYARGRFADAIEAEVFQGLINHGVLPVFEEKGKRWFLASDLRTLEPVLVGSSARDSQCQGASLFPAGLSCLRMSQSDYFELPGLGVDVDRAFFPAIRNLITFARTIQPSSSNTATNEPYFPPTRIWSASDQIRAFAHMQVTRAAQVSESKASEFANSAYYMGTKRDLTAFLFESMYDLVPATGVFVDLMCGSGVVSGVLARRWRTIASDSQHFSQLLAEVQGGGYTEQRASSFLSEILPAARDHAQELADMTKKFVAWEDQLFHTDLSADLRSEYQRFIDSLPTFMGAAKDADWRPDELVHERRNAPRKRPYVLFTAYFPNVFFSLRQCIEIDSLRWAIDSHTDEKSARWALGALTATVSRLATTYAGHFAQPPVQDWLGISLTQLANIIEKRAYSIFHEFSVRFLSLARESEQVPHEVTTVSGPWQSALNNIEMATRGEQVAVYFDPPYRREEYSRYYHVLESLVSYNYPTLLGKGRTPSKALGERFKSEFFTRNRDQMTKSVVRVLGEVLCRGWTCAWSYSSTADASIVDILNRLRTVTEFGVHSYSAPHHHNAQGGKLPRSVIEHLLVLTPGTNDQ